MDADIRRGTALTGNLSYELLEEGYQWGCYGQHEPLELRATPALLARIREYLRVPDLPQFNAAVLVEDSTLADNVVWFTGSQKVFEKEPDRIADVWIFVR